MILCYHSVSEQLKSITPDPWKSQINAALFESHLKFLQKNYRVVSLQEFLIAQQQNQPLPPYSVVLTFDDGKRNFFTVIAPRLAELSQPATAFIITDYTDQMSQVRKNQNPARKWTAEDDDLYLSWQEIQILKDEYQIEFGSHTCSHPLLVNLPLVDAEPELQNSYNAIAAKTGETKVTLSYPYGRATSELATLVESLNYSCALTTTVGGNRISTNPYLLRRTIINSDDNLPVFAARVAGLTWWFEKARTFLRPIANKVKIFRKSASSEKKPVSASEVCSSSEDIT